MIAFYAPCRFAFLAVAVTLASASVAVGDPLPGSDDLDARYRTLLRTRLAAGLDWSQDRLLGLAEETARDLYGADPLRMDAVGRRELEAVPELPPGLVQHLENQRRSGQLERVEIEVSSLPWWTRPWSAVRVAEQTLSIHKARALIPADLAQNALLALVCPPRIFRGGEGAPAPVIYTR